MPDDQGALAVLQDLLEGDDVADALELHGLDHVERLVEHQLLAAPELVEFDGRADVHPELAPAGEDVRRAVLVGLQEHAEAGGRLREPVDLLLEGHDLVAGLTEGVRQPLVLRGHACQVGLQLDDPLFENPRVPRRVGELASQDGDLLLKKGDLAHGVFRTTSGSAATVDVVVVGRHGPHLLQGELDVSRPYLGRWGLKPLDHKDDRGVSDLHPCARPSATEIPTDHHSESRRLYRRFGQQPSEGGCFPNEERQARSSVSDETAEALEVWIDQDLCTGDGICVQYAPEVFELDIDGLAYVKGDGRRTAPGPWRHRTRPADVAAGRRGLRQGVPRRLHPRAAGRRPRRGLRARRGVTARTAAERSGRGASRRRSAVRCCWRSRPPGSAADVAPAGRHSQAVGCACRSGQQRGVSGLE